MFRMLSIVVKVFKIYEIGEPHPLLPGGVLFLKIPPSIKTVVELAFRVAGERITVELATDEQAQIVLLILLLRQGPPKWRIDRI